MWSIDRKTIMTPTSKSCFFVVSLMAFLLAIASSVEERKVYVVYMGDQSHLNEEAKVAQHIETIKQATSSERDKVINDHLIQSYKRSFSGFSAYLTEKEAKDISGMAEVVSVFPQRIYRPLTTRSWDFMDLPTMANRSLTIERDIVIGVIDTGIWPESESFKDDGLGPPPAKWRGACQPANNFTCNNKIIGARYYKTSMYPVSETDFYSPRDSNGHGSHTASTVAGREVAGVSLDGFAEGRARGGVPSARLAVYKVCWSFGCANDDILAAFDDAIADGVDILSVSMGTDNPFGFPVDYTYDALAIGSFHAMKKGILTSASAGNSGPDLGTVTNSAPWILTVAASTIDRDYSDSIVLGNGQSIQGKAINIFPNTSMLPFIYAGDAPNTAQNFTSEQSKYCQDNTLDANKVKGKILLCTGAGSLTEYARTGIAGLVIINLQDFASSFSFFLPAIVLSPKNTFKILSYLKATRDPTASITRMETIRPPLFPTMSQFSSRGPSPFTPDILKPDVTAPGVNILAAFSPAAPISEFIGDKRRRSYNILSGTSMSCPHVSAAAAYIKSFHPTWTPAMVKSALMTTAKTLKKHNATDGDLAYGSGHIRPKVALDPGLVYDIEPCDYATLLCNAGYNTTLVRKITGDMTVCQEAKGNVYNINYPSLSLMVKDNSTTFNATFVRTVTNVGPANAVYKMLTSGGKPAFSVTVEPEVLEFKSVNEKKTFTVKISGSSQGYPSLAGSIIWYSQSRTVRSPVVVSFSNLIGSVF